MRFADMRTANEDRTKKGNLRKNAKALLEEAAAQHIPPATPTRPITGLDEHGQAAGDNNGGAHWRSRVASGEHNSGMNMRSMRRSSKSGRYGVQPMRSRIQRMTRRRRTGGVK